jgi:small subunit ribosomal protein S2
MTRLPGALFVVDIKRENIAIKEAQKLNIPIFAMVDTNSDPREVDYVIPSNDDASKSIEKILSLVTDSISEGLSERKNEKEAVEKGEIAIEKEVTVEKEVTAEKEVAAEKEDVTEKEVTVEEEVAAEKKVTAEVKTPKKVKSKKSVTKKTESKSKKATPKKKK